jgi:hypothetical protein
MSAIPTEHAAAVMERFETDVFSLANAQSQGVGNDNEINGIAHRRVGQGTNETMAPEDFAYAHYALLKAKIVPKNLIAIVDPSVAYALETSTNLVNVSNNPKWEGVIESGIHRNMRFVKNVFGFDIFESNLLADANETLTTGTTTAGKANVFMSIDREMLLPFAIAWRRRPKLDRQFDMKTREEQITTTARWGTLLSREDNLIVTLTDTDQV